jgi:hypothetical protein
MKEKRGAGGWVGRWVGGWSDILGRSSSRTKNRIKSGIGQPRNFKICGQVEAHWGSPQELTWQFGKIGSQITIWQSGLENLAKELSK